MTFINTLNSTQQVELIYIGYFDRAGDVAGVNYWNSVNSTQQQTESASASLTTIANNFALQLEAQATYPFLANLAPGKPIDYTIPANQTGLQNFISQVYTNLFNHGPDSAGATYWYNQISTGAVSLGAAVLAIANGATGADLQTEVNEITAATYFTTNTTSVDTTQTPTAVYLQQAHITVQGIGSGVNDPTVANSEGLTNAFVANGGTHVVTTLNGPYTLTPNIDTFTTSATAQIFNALPLVQSSGLANNTLNTGDTLTDNANDGTLNYTAITNDFAISANPPYALGVTLNGIKTLNITNQAANTKPFVDPGQANLINAQAGFQGNVTGLTTVNNNASINTVQLGGPGLGLNTVLTNYTSNGGHNQNFVALVAQSAFTGTSNAINIAINGLTGSAANTSDPSGFVGGSAIKLVFAPDGGTNGYETWNITSNNNAYLRLGQGEQTNGLGDFGSGKGAANNIVLSGAGSVELSALATGDFAGLKTINATAETGAVTLTGAAANVFGGYYSAVGSSGGNEAGLLTGAIAPTSIQGSSTAANFVDLSGLTPANINAMTTLTGNTATGVVNELILPNAVVEQSGALAGESGFQIIGDAGLTFGTINLANFTNANEIMLVTPTDFSFGNVNIKNGTSTFTLDLNGETGFTAHGGPFTGGHTFTVSRPTGDTSTTDVFNLDMGTNNFTNSSGVFKGALGADAAVGQAEDFIGNLLAPGGATGLTVNGYEHVNINVTDGGTGPTFGFFGGGLGIPDVIFGGISLTPTPGGGEILDITGTGDLLSVGIPASSLASFSFATYVPGTIPFSNIEYDVGGVAVNANNFIINASEGGVFVFGGTNALQVNGATSGGIIMFAPDDNTQGALLTGSTTGWNALAGSTGADVFNGGAGQIAPIANLEGDIFVTNGGTGSTFGDTVNLAPGHSLNHIDVYGSIGGFVFSGGALEYAPTPFAFGPNITDPFDFAQAGWWGLGSTSFPAVGGAISSVILTTGAPFESGISTSAVQINGFIEGKASAGGDVISFATSAWGSGGPIFGFIGGAGAVQGLTQGDATTAVAGGADANFGAHPLGPTGIISTGTTVVEISQIETNAIGLAGYLAGSDITFAGGGLKSFHEAHILFAYQTLTGVNIADVDFFNFSGATATNTGGAVGHVTGILASDLVSITGATLSTLNTHNIHFV